METVLVSVFRPVTSDIGSSVSAFFVCFRGPRLSLSSLSLASRRYGEIEKHADAYNGGGKSSDPPTVCKSNNFGVNG